jgi:hypothetical protein
MVHIIALDYESWFSSLEKRKERRWSLSSSLLKIIIVIISGPLAAFPAAFPIVFVSFFVHTTPYFDLFTCKHHLAVKFTNFISRHLAGD